MYKFRYAKIVSILLFLSTGVLAQMPVVAVPTPADEPPVAEDFTWWYISLFVLVAALGGAIFWMIKSRKADSAALVR